MFIHIFPKRYLAVSLDHLKSAEKLNEQMTELGSKFAAMQKAGVTSRLDARSMELINNVLAQTNAMPKEVEKTVNTAISKAVKQIDEKISKIKMLCIAITGGENR